MISVMNNNEFEVDRKPDLIADENRSEVRVTGELSVVSSANFVGGNGDKGSSSNLIGSGANDVSQGGGAASSGKAIYVDSVKGKPVNFVRSEQIGGLQALENRVDFSGPQKTRVSEVDEVMKSESADIRNEDVDDHKFDAQNDRGGHSGSRLGKVHVEVGKSIVSMSGEFAENGKGEALGAGLSTSVGYGYEVGDMVWGKVKSHPWWPGHIYNEAFASPYVRRTRTAGHVLVAFFGDSSYGWFEPAELIPFDANFSDKSRQTNSRNFLAAVEEAVDEVSRRRSLGLACRCRNPYNFRPDNVQGYFAVDVDNFELGGVYSVSQIQKARDSFQPRDTISFVKKLALMPGGDGQSSMDFIKNKATVLAYRKAVFEEFDETYAQAFGQQPVRPSRESILAAALPVRAPLSGPLVIAEALGKRKNSATKPKKEKDQANKNKYLFKRRDEPSQLKIQQKEQDGFSSKQPAYMGGSTASATGDYVFQKRPDSFPVWQTPAENSLLESKSSFDKGKGSIVIDGSDSSGKVRFQQPPSLPAIVEEVHGQEQVHSIGSGGHVVSTTDAKFHGQDSKLHVDTGTKKAKLLKRPVGELGAEESASGEKKKKKKRRKELGMEMRSDWAATGRDGLPPRADFQIDHQQIGNSAGTSLLPIPLGMPTRVGLENTERKLPQLLGDLQALALNPFHGLDSRNASIVQQAFLKFRSVAYQKSLALSIPTDMKSEELHAPTKSSAGSILGPYIPPGENIKNLPSLKQPTLQVRPDDPTKSGRKRGPSDRQEELAAKRVKKISDLKSLSVEKKAAQKNLEAQGDGKETVPRRPQKLLKPDSAKKMGPLAKARDPTMLVMKFPPNTSLPSGSELKARLARFGPLDHSGTRIFWQSLTCRVVFLHRADAEAAHKHLSGNSTLFGNVNMRCHIRPLGESKVQAEDMPADSAVEQKPPAQQQPVVQLKSCLKKPTGDEVGTATGGGGGRGTPRVKFVLGEEGEGSGGEQLMTGNKNNSASFGDGGASTSSHGMDFNSKNFQKVIPPTSLPVLSIPPAVAQFPNPPINLRYGEVANRNTHNFKINAARAGPSETNIDIAPQMLGLLIKCNDLVTNLSSFLGYVPYHPL